MNVNLVGNRTESVSVAKRPFKVLVASRSKTPLDEAVSAIATLGNLEIEERMMLNGCRDPLQDVRHPPDILIFRVGEAWAEELSALTQAPQTQLIVISSGASPTIMRAAMKAGARDFFADPLAAEALRESVVQLQAELSRLPRPLKSTLTAVINAKGGSGSSFLATNLAHQMVARSRLKVALVDLDIQFGSLSHYLDIEPRRGLFEALADVEQIDAAALRGYLVEHESGLALLGHLHRHLPTPDDISQESLSQLLNILSANYEHLVFDLPRQIDLVTGSVLEAADNILLIVQQSVASLLDATRFLGYLGHDLAIERQRIQVVVNRYDKRNPIVLKEIERVLKSPSLFCVPNDYRLVSESLNDGTPLLSLSKRAPITRALETLEQHITGKPDPGAGSLINRLFMNLRRA